MQVLRRTATSNDPWGPVGSDMAEIAQITFNKYAESPSVLTVGANYD
jgi:epsin